MTIQLTNLAVMLVLALATSITSGTSHQANQLVIMPKPYEGIKVRATLGEDFILTCIIQNEEASPSALQWVGPGDRVIDMIAPSGDGAQRIYSKLRQNQLVLYLQMIVPADAGVYTCRGNQDTTPQEAKVELSLEKKISFTNTQPEQFIRKDEDSVVICHATAIPGPEITWFRKGNAIEIKNDNKYLITNDGLTIKNAQTDDEGFYICQASVTSTGEVKRAEINVQVMMNPEWVLKPTDTEGVEGEDIVVKCEANAKPRPVYKWFRGDVLLAGDKYTISPNALRFKPNRYDTGTYVCLAENNYGKIQANFAINTLVGPSIAAMEDVHVIEGNLAKMRCNVENAYPKATVKWRITDTQQYIDPLNDTNFRVIDDSDAVYNKQDYLINSWSELQILQANRVHKRNYTCIATNKAAFAERQVNLLVEYKPTMLINQEARLIYYSYFTKDEQGMSGSSAAITTRAFPVTMTCLADAEPRPTITWFFKNLPIKHDNLRYRLIRDEPGFSKLEVNPRGIDDFGDYMCVATNRIGTSNHVIQLREATRPRFAPIMYLKAANPENILFDIKPSDAFEADGGMPIESFKVQWRFVNADFSNVNEKEIEVDLTKLDLYTVEINPLEPDTEYVFRVAAVNRPGVGAWSTQDLKIKTAPRRQPDPVRVTSKEECQAASRCYVEWVVDSTGGSIIREYVIRWRRIAYKDSANMHVNTDLIEPWSSQRVIKAPTSNYEITDLAPNSFYQVDILAKNDIGPSASQPFRIRTMPGNYGEAEDFQKHNAHRISRGIIIGASVLGALILFAIIDVLLLIKSNSGILALVIRSCSDKNKANLSEYKNKNPPVKIAQHNPTSAASRTPYQPIKQDEENNKVVISMKDSN